jgi:hypothetical protein
VRGGPFGHGLPGPASHSHADLLAPVLYLDGAPFWVDPGVYAYGVEPALRDAFRVWDAHGAVDLGLGPFPAGRFRWRSIPPPARLSWSASGGSVAIEGEVAWAASAGPRAPRDAAPPRPTGSGPTPGRTTLRWHRSMYYNELDETWRIADHIAAAAAWPAEWAFHFAPGVRVEQAQEAGVYRVTAIGGRSWQLRLEPAGDARVEDGWVAPAYGSRVTAPVLRRRLPQAPADAFATLAPLDQRTTGPARGRPNRLE